MERFLTSFIGGRIGAAGAGAGGGTDTGADAAAGTGADAAAGKGDWTDARTDAEKDDGIAWGSEVGGESAEETRAGGWTSREGGAGPDATALGCSEESARRGGAGGSEALEGCDISSVSVASCSTGPEGGVFVAWTGGGALDSMGLGVSVMGAGDKDCSLLNSTVDVSIGLD